MSKINVAFGVVTAIWLLLWASTLFFWTEVRCPWGGMNLWQGTISVSATRIGVPYSISRWPRNGGIAPQMWWPDEEGFYGRFHGRWYVEVPFWMLLVATGGMWYWLERKMRRPPAGHCACGYNLRGNVSGVCPECGTTVTAIARNYRKHRHLGTPPD